MQSSFDALAAVRTAVSAAAGHRNVTIEALQPYAYAKSAPLHRAAAVIDGRAVDLLVKDLTWGSLIGDAAAVKPAVLHNPLREVGMYRDVLGDVAGTAVFHGHHVDVGTGRHLLILELVDGMELCDVGALSAWCATARWLGEFHVRNLLPAAAGLPLVDHSPAHHRWSQQRAVAAAHHLGSVSRRRALAGVLAAHDRAIGIMCPEPAVLIHGELYPSNIIVGGAHLDGTVDEGALRICPVDWETAGRGPALLDLAALTTGDWCAADREAMHTAYRQGVTDAGGVAPADFDTTMAGCRLLLAVQWLGWFAERSAPGWQARDWLSEALDAAEHLDG